MCDSCWNRGPDWIGPNDLLVLHLSEVESRGAFAGASAIHCEETASTGEIASGTRPSEVGY